MTQTTPHRTTLVVGGTGKTGRRLVERVLARSPRDFADYARATAATGVWNPTNPSNLR